MSRRPEAGAAGRAGPRGVAAREPLEHHGQQVGGEAGTVVVHLDPHGGVVDVDPCRHLGAGRGVPGGVAQQVRDGLVQPHRVAGHLHGDVGQREPPAPLAVDDLRVGDGLGDEPAHVDRLPLQRASGVEAGEQQHVVDEGRHPLGLLLDLGQLVGAGASAELGVAADGGERGAQLVGRVGEELAHLLLALVTCVERPLDVPEQPVERLADLADLRAGVGERVGHPGRAADLAGVEGEGRDLVRRGGDVAQRTQLAAHEGSPDGCGDGGADDGEQHLPPQQLGEGLVDVVGGQALHDDGAVGRGGGGDAHRPEAGEVDGAGRLVGVDAAEALQRGGGEAAQAPARRDLHAVGAVGGVDGGEAAGGLPEGWSGTFAAHDVDAAAGPTRPAAGSERVAARLGAGAVHGLRELGVEAVGERAAHEQRRGRGDQQARGGHQHDDGEDEPAGEAHALSAGLST